MRKSIIIRHHDLYDHFGFQKTIKKIKEYHYFSYMQRYIKMNIRNCVEIILSRNKSGNQDGELRPIPPGRKSFDILVHSTLLSRRSLRNNFGEKSNCFRSY